MKIARTLITLSIAGVLGLAACKSAETPKPAEATPASAPASDQPAPAEGTAPTTPAEEKPAEGQPAPQR